MKFFLMVVVVILAGLGVWWYAPTDKPFENFIGEDPLPVVSLVEPKPREVPPGAHEYTNKSYGFSTLYPDIFSVRTINEGSGAVTIAFENKEKALGLQVFIVPYGEAQVSEERFLKDVPSGIRNDPKDFYIDGVLATGFYSSNAFLGETMEVWFIHKGLLYEVTAHRSMETLLSEILNTWQFI